MYDDLGQQNRKNPLFINMNDISFTRSRMMVDCTKSIIIYIGFAFLASLICLISWNKWTSILWVIIEPWKLLILISGIMKARTNNVEVRVSEFNSSKTLQAIYLNDEKLLTLLADINKDIGSLVMLQSLVHYFYILLIMQTIMVLILHFI